MMVHTAEQYPILIDENLLQKKLLSDFVTGTQTYIITDENVAPHYVSTVQDACKNFQTDTLILPPGEMYKTLSSFEKIIHACVASYHHRDTTLIALGGGVINDITGFAAACYQRGVDWISIPTTLLAQVDASVGGKTGVNHANVKNMIGAFYPPKAVLIDTHTLNTLPEREFRAGIAEIIKIALIQDAAFFEWLENNMSLLLSRNKKTLRLAIQQSCLLKRTVVAPDERETHHRAILNFGHTFAHAIETCTHFTWLHGEAVFAGLWIAVQLSRDYHSLSQSHSTRIQTLLTRHGFLKQSPPATTAHDLYRCMQQDKKIKRDQFRLVLLSDIAHPIITEQISESALLEVWQKWLQAFNFC